MVYQTGPLFFLQGLYHLIYWLMVWNMNFMFHDIWDNPSHWLSYFSEGLKPPTSHGLLSQLFGNIYHQYTPNISIYIPYMDPMGYIFILWWLQYFTCLWVQSKAPGRFENGRLDNLDPVPGQVFQNGTAPFYVCTPPNGNFDGENDQNLIKNWRLQFLD